MTIWSKEVFARNLKRYMDRSGKSQKDIAEEIGVSAPTFNEWIKGKKYPRIDKIEKLANYFNIKKSDLIEEKLTEEHKKDNDIIVNIIARLRTDHDFLETVSALYSIDNDRLSSVNNLLAAFLK